MTVSKIKLRVNVTRVVVVVETKQGVSLQTPTEVSNEELCHKL